MRRTAYRVVHTVLPPAVRRPLRRAVRRFFPNYLSVLEGLHEKLRPHTYVEIGVKHGRSLLRARPETLCVGIDPDPRLGAVAPNVRIFALTSAEFFREHDLRAVLGDRPVDLAFVDGEHSCDAVLHDIAELERFCTPSSVIAVHDVALPEVAKAIDRLRSERPDLGVEIVDVPPTGLALVRPLLRA